MNNERARTTGFSHPLWSFIADYKMVALMLTGKLKDKGRTKG